MVSSLNNANQLIHYNNQLTFEEQCFTNIAVIQNIGQIWIYEIYEWNKIENLNFKITSRSSRDQWVNSWWSCHKICRHSQSALVQVMGCYLTHCGLNNAIWCHITLITSGWGAVWYSSGNLLNFIVAIKSLIYNAPGVEIQTVIEGKRQLAVKLIENNADKIVFYASCLGTELW